MPQSDFVKYHQDISKEFESTKDQIRHLIGDAHWLSDGEHKEAILRKMLKSKLPDSLRVGNGFFCDRTGPSKQLDILITNINTPTLFREKDFVIVTSDCVKAIIEVKTNVASQKPLTEYLTKLADDIERVRKQTPDAWTGLFVFEDPLDTCNQSTTITRKLNDLLKALQTASKGEQNRVINCVSWGPNIFARFWQNPNRTPRSPLTGPGWHAYFFHRNHPELSPAYFISNLAMHTSSGQSREMHFAWYPIQTGMGKEDYRMNHIELKPSKT